MAKSNSTSIPSIFYDTGDKSGSYWFTLPDGALIRLGAGDVTKWLIRHGVSNLAAKGDLSGTDSVLLDCQHESRVDYAGPLAGHRSGLFSTTSGARILVTRESGVYLAKRKPGKIAYWQRFLSALLEDKAQIDAILDWWACSFQRLLNGSFAPGQALVLVGPAGCGKSLVQHLTTEIFGGRKADPFRYMAGATAFNGDLAEAEHLMIEDKHSSTDVRSRREFGARLKEMVVNRDMSIHAKGRQAITLHTWRRVTISVNDEVENLSILPPLDASILDKLTILRCRDAKATLSKDESATWKAFLQELPALRFMLLRREIPKARACPRFGVVAYHDPTILDAASTLEPQNRLLNLIDQILGEDIAESPLKLTAEALEMRLRQSPFAFAVEKLLFFSSACGVYLSSLAAKRPDRVRKAVVKGKTFWHILPPSEG